MKFDIEKSELTGKWYVYVFGQPILSVEKKRAASFDSKEEAEKCVASLEKGGSK